MYDVLLFRTVFWLSYYLFLSADFRNCHLMFRLTGNCWIFWDVFVYIF
jgi:hypothetical protein